MAKNKSNNNAPAETVITKAVAVEEKKKVEEVKVEGPARMGTATAPAYKEPAVKKTPRIYVVKETVIRSTPMITANNVVCKAAATSEYPILLKMGTSFGICYQVANGQYIFKEDKVIEI